MTRLTIEADQVARFNEVWAFCLESVPFYRSWATEHNLPARIQSVKEIESFPYLTKSILVERSQEVFQNGAIRIAYSTGGSSGTPARFPRGDHEKYSFYANTYVGRGWWNLKPLDSYLHVWGHAHLFGGQGGILGIIHKAKRKVLDFLANATRVNAYEMSNGALQNHYETLVRRNPTYMVGYTSAIFRLAQHVELNGLDVSSLRGLRGVIVTSEIASPADVETIGKVFGVPVIIEYGAGETGLIATSRGDSGPLHVLWHSFIVLRDDHGELTVTTLNERLFPLINYTIGDRGEGGDVIDGNVLTLDAVIGRSKDFVVVGAADDTSLELSAIYPVHILKSIKSIFAVQFRQESPETLTIFLSANHSLSLDEVADMFSKNVRLDHPDYDASSVTFVQVPEPVLSISGKQALFV
jgi:phenylacetate-CoA ligase